MNCLFSTGVAVALKQAQRPEFKVYQQQVCANAQAMCKALQARGYTCVSGMDFIKAYDK